MLFMAMILTKPTAHGIEIEETPDFTRDLKNVPFFQPVTPVIIALQRHESIQARRNMLKSILGCDDNELDELIQSEQIYV
jgi:hypothetical protein